MVLAASGPELVLRRRLEPMQLQVEQAGMVWQCSKGRTAVYADVAVPISHQWVGCWLSRMLAMAGAVLINRGPQVCGSISIVSKAGSRLFD